VSTSAPDYAASRAALLAAGVPLSDVIDLLAPVTAAVRRRVEDEAKGGLDELGNWHDPGNGQFAPRGFVSFNLLRRLLRGDGQARSEIRRLLDDHYRSTPGWDTGLRDDTRWAVEAFGDRPAIAGPDRNAWDAGFREVRNWHPPTLSRTADQERADVFRPDIARLGIADWETTRPWQYDQADVAAGRSPGWLQPGARAHASYEHRDGNVYLRVSPDYWSSPPETRRATLYHEAGHVLDAMLPAADKQAAYNRLTDGPSWIPSHDNPDEMTAEAYALLHTNPQWLVDHQPALHQWVIDQADRHGLPVPDAARTVTPRPVGDVIPGGSKFGQDRIADLPVGAEFEDRIGQRFTRTADGAVSARGAVSLGHLTGDEPGGYPKGAEFTAYGDIELAAAPESPSAPIDPALERELRDRIPLVKPEPPSGFADERIDLPTPKFGEPWPTKPPHPVTGWEEPVSAFKLPNGRAVTVVSSGGDSIDGYYLSSYVMNDTVTGDPIGYLDYTSGHGELAIRMVEVDPGHRGEQAADALLAYTLAATDPNAKVDPGYRTNDGDRWWNRVREWLPAANQTAPANPENEQRAIESRLRAVLPQAVGPVDSLNDYKGVDLGHERTAHAETLARSLLEHDLGDGVRSKVTEATLSNGQLVVSGVIEDSDGVEVGQFDRSFYIDSDGAATAYQIDLAIDPAHQGQGIGTRFLAASLDAYLAAGVDKVTVYAVSDPNLGANGGYTWARAGFDWDPTHHSSLGEIGRHLRAAGDDAMADRVEQVRAKFDAGEPLDASDITPYEVATIHPDIMKSGVGAWDGVLNLRPDPPPVPPRTTPAAKRLKKADVAKLVADGTDLWADRGRPASDAQSVALVRVQSLLDSHPPERLAEIEAMTPEERNALSGRDGLIGTALWREARGYKLTDTEQLALAFYRRDPDVIAREFEKWRQRFEGKSRERRWRESPPIIDSELDPAVIADVESDWREAMANDRVQQAFARLGIDQPRLIVSYRRDPEHEPATANYQQGSGTVWLNSRREIGGDPIAVNVRGDRFDIGDVTTVGWLRGSETPDRRAVLTHETGHYVHDSISDVGWVGTPLADEWKRLWDRYHAAYTSEWENAWGGSGDRLSRMKRRFISFYSNENAQEGFAEAFAAAALGGDTSDFGPEAQALIDWMNTNIIGTGAPAAAPGVAP